MDLLQDSDTPLPRQNISGKILSVAEHINQINQINQSGQTEALDDYDYGKDLTEYEEQFRRNVDEQTLKRLKIQIKELRANRQMRKEYANKLFIGSAAWLGVILLFVFFQGLKLRHDILGWNPPIGFELSERVMLAILVTTSLNIIGLFLVVVKWLFHPNPIETHKRAIEQHPNGTTPRHWRGFLLRLFEHDPINKYSQFLALILR